MEESNIPDEMILLSFQVYCIMGMGWAGNIFESRFVQALLSNPNQNGLKLTKMETPRAKQPSSCGGNESTTICQPCFSNFNGFFCHLL